MLLRRLSVALASLVAALGFTVLTERPALACSCLDEPAADLVARSDVAFIGTGVAFTPSPVRLKEAPGLTPEPTGVASFKVQEAVKGVKEGDMVSVVQSAPSGGSHLGSGCEVGFPLGEQFVVLGRSGESGLAPWGCVPTVEELRAVALGPPVWAVPAGGFVIVVGLVLAGFLLLRRRGSRSPQET